MEDIKVSKKVLENGGTAISYCMLKNSRENSLFEHRDFARDDRKQTVTIPDEEVKP